MSDQKREKIILIDGHSILNRAFYGLPLLSDSEGLHTNAVLGFLNIMFHVLDEEKAQYLAVAFDLHAPTFRHKMYDAYKGTRHPMPEELREQVPVMKDVLQAMNVPLMSLEGFEADDLIGTVSLAMEQKGLDVRIISGDRDLLQLASDTTMVRIPKTKKEGREVENYYAGDVKEKYLVTPSEFVDVKALMGDASDNIPGIPGVGEKTATKIIAEFHSIQNAHDHLDEIKPNKARLSLQDNWEMAQLSYRLALIDRHAPFALPLEQARLGEDNSSLYTKEAMDLLKRLELRQMVRRFADHMQTGPSALPSRQAESGANPFEEQRADTDDTEPSGQISLPEESRYDEMGGFREQVHPSGEDCRAADEESKSSREADEGGENFRLIGEAAEAEAFLGRAVKEEKIGLYVLAEDSRLLGAAVAAGAETVLLLPVTRKQLAVLTSGNCLICGINLKEQLSFLDGGDSFPEEQQSRYFDCAVGAYLLNPLAGTYVYDGISSVYTGRLVETREELLGKKSLLSLAGLAEDDLALLMSGRAGEKRAAKKQDGPSDRESARQALTRFSCLNARTALAAMQPIRDSLEKEDMLRLFTDIEMPLMFTLYHMQQAGILVRGDELRRFGHSLSGRIDELEKAVWEQAGQQFNINSPKQLGTVLFEDMKLPGGKKTKTGYSTSADVLENLAQDVPIARLILEYRQLTKLKSTYADGLVQYIAEDGRIHGRFNQTVTATGRISSTDPNLQNIPVRTELGAQLRKVFVPKNGSIFVDADYSQIELRVLASASDDQNLIDAYNSAEDIHAITASKVFHVPLDEVTPQLRRNAKAVNFGIVYGISSFGLSQGLSITAAEAQSYINQYFETYPGIKSFLDGCIQSAKTRGYSVTMFGRRRPVPELKEKNFMRRKFGERVAMNAPIQGTAADIIKIAMVGVDRRLREEGLKSRLVLQVHDELLVETEISEKDQVETILREEMEGAAKLRVRLEIDMKSGESWFEAH